MKRILSLFVLIIFLENTFAQKQSLGLNLSVGETYHHLMQSESIVKQDINGQQMTIDMNISGKIAFKVTDLKDSVYDINVNYQQLALTMKLPNGSVSFNSEKNDENDLFSKILGAIIEKTFMIKMNRLGKIVQVKNLDSIFEHVFDNFPQITGAKKQQFKSQLMQAYGEKSFKGNFEMITAIYSGLPVATGNTWVIKTKLETGMAAVLTTTFEYRERTNNYILIIGKGLIETADKDAYSQVNGMPAKYNLKGTMNSSIKVDNNTGWIIESKINQLIDGTVEIKDNPKWPGGMTIPMSIESIMTYGER